MKIFYFSLLSCFFCFFSFTYEQPSNISNEDWIQLKKYLFPEETSLKRSLDLFFRKKPLESLDSFERAGFIKPFLRASTNIVLGKHPNYPNYLFKVFLDDQPVMNEWIHWLKRINGANAIREAIQKKQFQNFVVPKKWIYQIPIDTIGKGPFPKRYVLIVEEMKLLSPRKNRKAFKKIKKSLLKELAILIKEEGLIDSVFPDNIPFTTTGKIAFIDTEHFHLKEEIPFRKLSHFLSPESAQYWESFFLEPI